MAITPKVLYSETYVVDVCRILHNLMEGTREYCSTHIDDIRNKIAYDKVMGRCQGVCYKAGLDTKQMLENLYCVREGLKYEETPGFFGVIPKAPGCYKCLAVEHAIKVVNSMRSRFLTM